MLVIAGAVGTAIIALLALARGGSPDGPAAFLWHDDESAIFLQWTRTGDDVSGSMSAAEVTKPEEASSTGFLSVAPAPGQVQQQTGPFTGTVREDSVRLLVGSGSVSNRVNGRLHGDSLEITIPQDVGVATRRLTPAARGDYTNAIQQIRDHGRQRKADAEAALARKQRADKIAIVRVAAAFQKALDAASRDDPCRYVTSQVKQTVRGFDFGSGRPTCTSAIRQSDAETPKPVFKAPLGVAAIEFGPLPPLGISLAGGPSGAVVSWRPKPAAGFKRGRATMFIEQRGRWLVYRCCP